MAEITVFHFQAGNTLIYRLNTKLKLLLLLIYSFSIYQLSLKGVLFLSAFIFIAVSGTLTKPAGLIRQMKGFIFILILIVAASMTSVTGDPLFTGLPFPTREGLLSGMLAGWRFVMIIILGLIFTTTTRPNQIHAAVGEILKPFPLVNESAIAARMSLTIMFIPILMDMLNEIREARKARYIEGSRNPVKNISTITVPLISGVILRAGETSMAMESRLYSGALPGTKQAVQRKEYLLFAACLVPVVPAFLL